MNRRMLLSLIVGFLAHPAYTISLSTSFVDVTAGAVAVGDSVEVDTPLYLWNSSETGIDVQIQALIPSEHQLRDAAWPIADPGWIRVEPDRFHLPGGGKQTCRVFVQIPKNKKNYCRSFQAMIWSRGTPPSARGITLSGALLSRLRIKTADLKNKVCQ